MGASTGGRKLGLNAVCPCGSGKKYKSCCWGKRFIWVVDQYGNIFREIPIDDLTVTLLREAREEFRKHHGRNPGPSDLVFGDIGDEQDIEEIITDIMEQAGLDPAYIYACKKTGRLVTAWNKDKLSDGELREWQTAVEEYRACEK